METRFHSEGFRLAVLLRGLPSATHKAYVRTTRQRDECVHRKCGPQLRPLRGDYWLVRGRCPRTAAICVHGHADCGGLDTFAVGRAPFGEFATGKLSRPFIHQRLRNNFAGLDLCCWRTVRNSFAAIRMVDGFDLAAGLGYSGARFNWLGFGSAKSAVFCYGIADRLLVVDALRLSGRP